MEDLQKWVLGLKLSDMETQIAEAILRELKARLAFLVDVGLPAHEALAAQLGSYVERFLEVLAQISRHAEYFPKLINELLQRFKEDRRLLLLIGAAAGIAGPVLLNELREGQIQAGVAPADAYTSTLYIMVGLLAVGLVCNLLVRPVAEKHHFKGDVNDPD